MAWRRRRRAWSRRSTERSPRTSGSSDGRVRVSLRLRQRQNMFDGTHLASAPRPPGGGRRDEILGVRARSASSRPRPRHDGVRGRAARHAPGSNALRAGFTVHRLRRLVPPSARPPPGRCGCRKKRRGRAIGTNALRAGRPRIRCTSRITTRNGACRSRRPATCSRFADPRRSDRPGSDWITILRKRAAYRKAFANFDARRVARFGAANEAATRRRRDPECAIAQDRCRDRERARVSRGAEGSRQLPAAFLWEHVGGKPIQKTLAHAGDVPPRTDESRA